MSPTLTEPRSQDAQPGRPQLPDATSLEERVPDWIKAPRSLAGFTGLVGFVYLVLNYIPIWYTDVWGHLAYGRLIWSRAGIPQTEPLLSLAKGMPFVDTAWLSQLIGFGAISYWGPPGLQFLYAASITLCVALLLWRSYRTTHNVWITLAGFGLFMWVAWWQLLILRPQLAGLVCFVSLFVLLTSPRRRLADWFFVPILFAVWANVHGSFLVGLGLLGCFTLGRGADVLRRTWSLSAVFRDRKTRRLFVLTELAAAAVLANPYGLGQYTEVISVVRNPNVWALVEWRPLNLQMMQGQAAFAAALALMVVYRMSPRRISCVEVLVLAGLGGCALWTSRMILWWAPAAAYWFVMHAGASWRRRSGSTHESSASPRSGLWSVVCVGIAWIAFAYTSFGGVVIHGQTKGLKGTVASFTPLSAVEYLNRKPPEGLVFNTFEWGDFLLWAGPKDIQIFAASHVHLLPREVWRHYLEICDCGPGWKDLLDRYGVNTVVIDHANRGTLIGGLLSDSRWKVRYEDSLAVVFVRRKPI